MAHDCCCAGRRIGSLEVASRKTQKLYVRRCGSRRLRITRTPRMDLCVDFAYKDWEQAGKKWALRNIKLRTSRKLLFVSGLLTVFSCFQNEELRRAGDTGGDYLLKLQTHLLKFVHSTPLNIFVWTLRNIGLDDRCVDFLNHYEQFLSQINEKATRDHLAGLSEDDVYDDAQFLECRIISHNLQSVLKQICFDDQSPLRDFTCEYGVF